MRIEDKIIEVQEEVRFKHGYQDIVLEKGDKIQIINGENKLDESTYEEFDREDWFDILKINESNLQSISHSSPSGKSFTLLERSRVNMEGSNILIMDKNNTITLFYRNSNKYIAVYNSKREIEGLKFILGKETYIYIMFFRSYM